MAGENDRAKTTARTRGRRPAPTGQDAEATPLLTVARGRPGPKPAADREQVLAATRWKYVHREPIDMQAIAAELGLGRTTLYRWFGDRDALLGDVMWGMAREVLVASYDRAHGTGARRLQETIEGFSTAVATFDPLLHLLQTDPQRTVSILMAPDGLQGRLIAAYKDLADHEVRQGHYRPLLETEHIAYLIVQTGMTYLFGTALVEQPPDVEHALAVARRILSLEEI